MQFALLDGQIDAIRRGDAAKALVQIGDGEKAHFLTSPRTSPTSPPRTNSTTAISSRPKGSFQ